MTTNISQPSASIWFKLILVVVAPVALLLDQLSKWTIEARLPAGQFIAPWPAVGDYFTFHHVYNFGMAFGSLQGLGQTFGGFFAIAAVAVTAFLLYYNFFLLHPPAVAQRIAFGLIIGGGLGNAVDRFRLGHVTDFIRFNFRPLFTDTILDFRFWDIPVFNVADMWIFAGVFMWAVVLFFDDTPAEENHWQVTEILIGVNVVLLGFLGWRGSYLLPNLTFTWGSLLLPGLLVLLVLALIALLAYTWPEKLPFVEAEPTKPAAPPLLTRPGWSETPLPAATEPGDTSLIRWALWGILGSLTFVYTFFRLWRFVVNRQTGKAQRRAEAQTHREQLAHGRWQNRRNRWEKQQMALFAKQLRTQRQQAEQSWLQERETE